ncbi:permease prefix domain 1-containing protein [Intestinimonas timonensis]|uniref:permease prefix domain 1-containing protein n=1 Tax=Intestinimonas timonensis TaxID=1689270 RepID=UPI001030A511|nr:permease prefix domain 1-containing protein [Intestinimonas timonensis]
MYRHQFCELVTGQLRCKWEAPSVRQELSDHIQDHQAALMAEGMGRDQAEEAAVAAMGDPEELGKALDALHSPWPWRLYHAARTAAFVLLAFAFFLGFDVLLGSGGSGAVFWGDSGYTMPEQDPQSLLEYYSFIDSDTVRTTGTVTGGGDIGPYRLSPAGEALFLTRENGDTQLAFLVSTFHPQPWLESLKLYDLACSASDDLGNQYSSDQFYFLNTGGRLRDLCWVLLEDPAPAACRFTFTLDTDRGSVTFTITPEGGENA